MRIEMGEEKVEIERENQELPIEEEEEEESNLQKLVQSLSSLISLSNSIKVFQGKWQLMRSKLEELKSGLTAAENCDFDQNSVFSELIPAILVTINDCFDLANRCLNLSYSGKLLMQSDLDILCSKFDVHLKSLTGIYTTGILTSGSAIVVSRPSFGASKDDMKFYVNDLLTRLKIGDTQMKKQALIALSEVIMEDEKYVRILVDIGEIIHLLVDFLDFAEMGIQEESMKIISVIAGFSSYKGVLIGAGIVAPLIRVLDSGSDLGKERSARVLEKLTENSDNAWLVSAQGGVTALLKICTNGDDTDLTSTSIACGVLKNLAGVEEIKRFMVEEGAISAFVKLIRSKDEASQINAIEFLQIMASGDENEYIRQIFVREGGIYSLVQVLDPKSSFSSKSLEISLRAIEKLCFNSSTSLNSLMNYGFLDRLLLILQSNEVSAQELALKVSVHLCGLSEETKKAMGDSNFMPEFIRLLDARSFEVRELASEVISKMILVPRNKRRFMQEDCNVNRILQLLDPDEEKSGNKKFLLSILMTLTNCNNGRRKITHSNYIKNLEKLAEGDIIDAKKIIKKLSTNRFRNILNGMWKS